MFFVSYCNLRKFTKKHLTEKVKKCFLFVTTLNTKNTMDKKKTINIRCTPAEKTILRKLAFKSEMNLSEYLRFKGMSNSIING